MLTRVVLCIVINVISVVTVCLCVERSIWFDISVCRYIIFMD